jgi:hypothetical protein
VTATSPERRPPRAATEPGYRDHVQAAAWTRGGGDRGAALPEFVMVAVVVTFVFGALLQLAFALHVRTVLVDCVAEGARYGALGDRDPQDGVVRARDLISLRLGERYAQDVRAGEVEVAGLPVVEVSATAPLPVIGPLGTATTVTVSGHGALP